MDTDRCEVFTSRNDDGDTLGVVGTLDGAAEGC
jgi:hypothetical protein